jgi:hypothetical protein
MWTALESHCRAARAELIQGGTAAPGRPRTPDPENLTYPPPRSDNE